MTYVIGNEAEGLTKDRKHYYTRFAEFSLEGGSPTEAELELAVQEVKAILLRDHPEADIRVKQYNEFIRVIGVVAIMSKEVFIIPPEL